MNRYIDSDGGRFGVEPICRVLEANPSTYYAYKRRGPSQRDLSDEWLLDQIRRVFEESDGNYGARKVWKQLRREEIFAARCTVERLMRRQGMIGTRRGRPCKTTRSDPRAELPEDLVDRRFQADRPNQLWVADITYVRTWAGQVHVAFVVDVFSRFIVGWSMATHLKAELPLEALEMGIWRRDRDLAGLIHHSDRGSQYTSIIYTDRLIDAGIEPSVGSVGDSYDNALAESVIGLYKAELIYRKGPWRRFEDVELATLEWIDWWNQRRLHSSIGDVPPAEFEAAYAATIAQHTPSQRS
jgi:putative transposase